MRIPLSGFSLASAMRMVHGVHGQASYRRPDAHPALAAGLTYAYGFMLNIAELTYRCMAVKVDEPYLAGRKPHMPKIAFLGHNLRGRAGTAHDLAALAFH